MRVLQPWGKPCALSRLTSLPLAPSRTFSGSIVRMLKAEDLKVSSDSPADEVLADASKLIDKKGWTICFEGKGLERSFKFKGFKAAWDFMNHVAAECKKQKHHPEWTNIYNQTRIRWTTHNPEGLSSKDTRMAHFCDEAGKIFGEVQQPQAQPQQHSDEWESDARECCAGPNKGQSAM